MRVLVTGGAGFIGSISVEALVAAGHEVIVLDDLSKGHRAAVAPENKYCPQGFTPPEASVHWSEILGRHLPPPRAAGHACKPQAGTSWPSEQVGQSEQPRPDCDSRTAAPVSTMPAMAAPATATATR